jgi:Pyruvate/2-oxoacid:ferredoxin oxidoreductase gamma subunit
VVLVSDIGCSGLSDQYFVTSAFHGLHGRSVTYASGIKLARPDLKVIVLMGDGGTGIGGTHLLNAARRNIGLTVLVFNNFNFGMTGGQHSTTTPTGARTTTTPGGNLERPLDVCATVAANGAGFVWRGTSFDTDLAERMAEAIRVEGFSLLDVWELCTAYFVPANKASKKTLATTLDALGLQAGVLSRIDRVEYAAAYRQACQGERGKPVIGSIPVEPRFVSSLTAPFRLVVAGSAGGKVRSAARLVAESALACGLWAAQRDDYPITVKTGHSLSEVVLSPDEIHYTGITRPDALVVLTPEGRAKVGRQLAAMGPEDRVFHLPVAGEIVTRARRIALDAGRLPGRRVALFALAAAVRECGILPLEALEAAAGQGEEAWARENLETIAAARALAPPDAP